MFIKRRSFLVNAGIAAALTSSTARLARAQQSALPVISVADFGALPNGSDAGPGVKAAIARLPKRGGAVLHFPKGTYQFAQTSGAALLLAGFEGVTVDGSGSEFVFQGLTVPFLVRDSRTTTLRGFSIDWGRPPYSQGEIIGVDPGRRTIDVAVDSRFPVDGSEKIAAISVFEPNTGLAKRGGADIFDPTAVSSVELVRSQTLRLNLARQLPLSAGDVLVLRHTGYVAHALNFDNCVGLRIADLQIFAAPGMGAVGHYCKDVSFQHVNVLPRPGSGRMISTSADGIHFGACAGILTVDSCLVSGTGDDCINVNTGYVRLAQRLDNRTVTVAQRGLFSPAFPPRSGNLYTISDGDTFEPITTAVIGGGEISGSLETLHFLSDLPPQVRPGAILADNTQHPKLTVSNCKFPGNRARGVLGHSDVTIENCDFANQTMAAMLFVHGGYWMEGPAIDRVRIHNNRISGAQRRGLPSSAAIDIDASVRLTNEGSDRNLGISSHDIEISGNTIHDPGGTAILANSAGNLSITNNKLENTGPDAIILGKVRNVTIAENSCNPQARISVIPESANQVKFSNNTGLSV